jgi:hypothetical protein
MLLHFTDKMTKVHYDSLDIPFADRESVDVHIDLTILERENGVHMKPIFTDMKVLESFTSMRTLTLDFTDTGVEDEDIYEIFSINIYRLLTSLTVYLSRNNITDDGLDKILYTLYSMSKLTALSINLDDNLITSCGKMELSHSSWSDYISVNNNLA